LSQTPCEMKLLKPYFSSKPHFIDSVSFPFPISCLTPLNQLAIMEVEPIESWSPEEGVIISFIESIFPNFNDLIIFIGH